MPPMHASEACSKSERRLHQHLIRLHAVNDKVCLSLDSAIAFTAITVNPKSVTKLFPAPPPPGSSMLATRPSQAVRSFLAMRKSANKLFLKAPGPPPDEVDELLSIAARVPDHRKLTPWRFLVFEGESRTSFGAELARIAGLKPDAEARDVVDAAGLFLRAPVVIAVISAPVEDGRTPIWEQELSAGAVCYNLLLAGNASGWAGVWLTEWMAYDPDVAGLLGLRGGERVAGFVYLGTPAAAPQERIRPEMTAIVRRWPQDGA